MESRRPLTLLVVVALLGTSVGVAAVDASPQPRYVCGTCGVALDRTTTDMDVSLNATGSRVRIHVREDGSARWTARTELTPESADRLRENPDLLDRILDRTYGDESYRVVEEPASDVSASLDGNDLVVEFTVADVAHRSVGGVLLVDYFHGYGRTRRLVLAADRMEMDGPSGTVVTNDVPAAAERESTVVWTGGERWGTDVSDRGFVAFAPDDGPVTTATTQVAVAAAIGPTVLEQAIRFATIPGLILLLFVGAGVVGAERLAGRFDPDPGAVAAWVAALGVAAAVLVFGAWFLGGSVASFGLPPAAAYAVVAVATLAAIRRERGTLPGLVVAVVAGTVVAGLVALVGPDGGVVDVATSAFLTLAGLLFLPLGYAVGADSTLSIPIAAAVPTAVGVSMLTVEPIQGIGAFFLVVFLIVWAIVVGTFGLALFFLGHRIARENAELRPSVGTDSFTSI